MNQLARTAVLPIALGAGMFDRMFDRFNAPMFSTASLMNQYRTENGSVVLEYNLAGFSEDEISVKADTALGELIIKAEHGEEGNKRVFNTTVTLSPYTSPEDITAEYVNGVLRITVAPLEKRKEESLVTIPFKKIEKTVDN